MNLLDSIDDPQLNDNKFKIYKLFIMESSSRKYCGGNSEDSVKKVVYRYLNKLNYKN